MTACVVLLPDWNPSRTGVPESSAIGHLHSFTFLELLPSLTLLSGGSTDALLSREVIGGVLLQSVWCVLLGVISTTCGFLLVIQTLCACYTGWGNVHGDAVGCPPCVYNSWYITHLIYVVAYGCKQCVQFL